MKKTILLILFLLITTALAYAETWELAIQPYDKADLANGHKRSKKGDIIAVKPHPWTWGKKEVENYLIVTVDGLTAEEAYKLTEPEYDMSVEADQFGLRPVIGKRRYAIDVDRLKNAVNSKVSDFNISKVGKNYQPFDTGAIKIDLKKDNIVFDKTKNKTAVPNA